MSKVTIYQFTQFMTSPLLMWWTAPAPGNEALSDRFCVATECSLSGGGFNRSTQHPSLLI
jgi:hypothetical protein